MFVKEHQAKPRGNKGIRDRGLKQQLGLGSEENVNDTFRVTLGLEITKSPVFCQDSKNRCQDTVEGSAPSEMKEETSKALPSEKMMMVVHLEQLAPYQGIAWDERP
jgi:hypothetical protein